MTRKYYLLALLGSAFLCGSSTSLGQPPNLPGGRLTIGKRVERHRVGFEKSLSKLEYRLGRATKDLIETSKVSDEQQQRLKTETIKFIEAKRRLVAGLLDEASTRFDQSLPGNRPLGGPFKDLSDLNNSLRQTNDDAVDEWFKYVSSVLSERQVESFEKNLRHRGKFHRDAQIRQWVVEVDNRVYLSEHQRLNLLLNLGEWYSAQLSLPNPPLWLMNGTPMLPVEELQRVLDEEQMEVWSSSRR